MNDIERNIIKNSEYIITYFNKHDREVTNLKLQKLLYFLEAIYMITEDEEELFLEDFYAWNFGPVSDKVYNEYKFFGSLPIELDKSVEINPLNLKYIEILYDLFCDFTATQLVNLSHMNGSPWFEIYRKNNGNIPEREIISKKDTKEWFKKIVTKKEDNSEK